MKIRKFNEKFGDETSQINDYIVNKTILNVIKTKEGDEGFVIIFDDGTTLDVGFSGEEGIIKVDNVEVKCNCL
jgi:hypothetical protein